MSQFALKNRKIRISVTENFFGLIWQNSFVDTDQKFPQTNKKNFVNQKSVILLSLPYELGVECRHKKNDQKNHIT